MNRKVFVNLPSLTIIEMLTENVKLDRFDNVDNFIQILIFSNNQTYM